MAKELTEKMLDSMINDVTYEPTTLNFVGSYSSITNIGGNMCASTQICNDDVIFMMCPPDMFDNVISVLRNN